MNGVLVYLCFVAASFAISAYAGYRTEKATKQSTGRRVPVGWDDTGRHPVRGADIQRTKGGGRHV